AKRRPDLRFVIIANELIAFARFALHRLFALTGSRRRVGTRRWTVTAGPRGASATTAAVTAVFRRATTARAVLGIAAAAAAAAAAVLVLVVVRRLSRRIDGILILRMRI